MDELDKNKDGYIDYHEVEHKQLDEAHKELAPEANRITSLTRTEMMQLDIASYEKLSAQRGTAYPEMALQKSLRSGRFHL